MYARAVSIPVDGFHLARELLHQMLPGHTASRDTSSDAAAGMSIVRPGSDAQPGVCSQIRTPTTRDKRENEGMRQGRWDGRGCRSPEHKLTSQPPSRATCAHNARPRFLTPWLCSTGTYRTIDSRRHCRLRQAAPRSRPPPVHTPYAQARTQSYARTLPRTQLDAPADAAGAHPTRRSCHARPPTPSPHAQTQPQPYPPADLHAPTQHYAPADPIARPPALTGT